VLHVTSGSSAVERLRAAGIDGDRLPWNDVLHGVLDAIELNGIDRCMGGVRLAGRAVPWRWDPREGRVAAKGEGRQERDGWDADGGDPNLIPRPAAQDGTHPPSGGMMESAAHGT
jgi:hypothetical protein